MKELDVLRPCLCVTVDDRLLILEWAIAEK